VCHLSGCDVLEDDFALFSFVEPPVGYMDMLGAMA